MIIKATLLVMAGGAIGAALRFHAGRLMSDANANSSALFGAIPLGTLMVNIIGGFLMGGVMAFLMRSGAFSDVEENLRLLLGVGLLGGFTTFSAFSLEMAMMIERGAWVAALIYALISVSLALIALFLGMIVIRAAL